MQYEVNVRLLLAVIRHKFSFFCIGLAGTLLLTILYLHVAPRQYTVSLVVTAATPSQNAPNSRLASLGSLAGIDLTGGGNGNLFKLYVASLQTPAVAGVLASQPRIMREMYPAEWSAEHNRFEERTSVVRFVLQGIRGLLGLPVPPWTPPNAARVAEYLKSQLLIVQDDRSGVVTLQIQSVNPQAARDILAAVNRADDELMRKRALARSDGYIKYLTDTLPNVSVAEYRSALIENLAQQVEIQMMARAGVPFISDVLSGPTASAYPTSPAALVFLFLGTVVGMVVGAGLALAANRYGWTLSQARHSTMARVSRLFPQATDAN